MKKKRFFAVCLSLIMTAIAAGVWATPADTTQLKPKVVYGKEAKVIAFILDNNHYRKIQLNDSLSGVILDGFIKNLDNNKTYFTTADLQSFEKYRTKVDDLIKDEDVSIAYNIYSTFRKRFDQRMQYVFNTLINQSFDYTVEEEYETDRDKEPWCKNDQELNEV